MQVDTELTQDDYRAFVNFVCKPPRHLSVLSLAIWSVLWCGFGLMLLLAAQLVVRPAFHTSKDSELLIVVGICALLCAGIVFVQRRLRTRALPSRGGVVLGRRTYRLTDEGFHEAGAGNESLTRWSAVQDVKETDQHLFVMLDRTVGYIVPKHSFASRDTADEFKRTILDRRLAASAKPAG